MPYVSKHYTCKEIDRRLLQGYYDDFVQAGFVGTLKEFLAFVLSIKDKIDASDAIEALNTLEIKLKNLIQEAEDRLTGQIDTVNNAIPTKVSQLENDLLYQTQTDVENYISRLVNGADEALDTLLELANALNNDPNFATNITNLVTSVKTNLEAEIQRAREAEADLQSKLDVEQSKRETSDSEIRELIEAVRDTLLLNLQTALTDLNSRIDEFNQKVLDIVNQVNDYKSDTNAKIVELTQAIHIESDKLKDLVNEKVGEESDRAKTKEQEILDKLTEYQVTANSEHTEIRNSITELSSNINQEAITRKAEDDKLKASIQEEAAARAIDKADLLSKISEEVTHRTAADSDLQTKLSAEVSAREQGDQTNKTAIELEVTNRTNENNLIRQTINHNQELADAAIKKVADELSSEVSRAIEIENGKVDKKEGYELSKNDFTDRLLEKLNNIQEYANNITKVSELVNDANYQTQADVNKAIEDVIGGAPDILNTLKELADALGNDPNFATTLTQNLAALGTQLNQEISDRRQQKEDITIAYTQAITNAVTEINAAYSNLSNNLETAKTSFAKDIEVLQKDISDLEEDTQEVVTNQNQKINTLRESLVQNTNDLNTAINAIKSSVEASILVQESLIRDNTSAVQRNLELIQALQKQYQEQTTDFTSIIQNEVDSRKIADDKLQAEIDKTNAAITKEITDREVADNTLQTNISNEVTIRQNEDAKLQAKITELKTALDAEKAARETLAQEFEDFKDSTLALFNDIYNIIKK